MCESNPDLKGILQPAFNKVLFALREQGKPSAVMHGENAPVCMYRMEDPERAGVILKCAAGHLIRDEDYFPDLETLPTNHILLSGVLQRAGYVSILRPIREMQRVHDRWAVGLFCQTSPEGRAGALAFWERGMKELAGESGIHYTEPTGSTLA